MALFRMENPELGAPAVAPSVPAWCPGGRTHTNAVRAWLVSTRSTACTTPPAARSAAAIVPGEKNVSLSSFFFCFFPFKPW
jgi:hypothetical protein